MTEGLRTHLLSAPVLRPRSDVPSWPFDEQVERSNAHSIVATILVTDIVGSTHRAAALGDGAWRRLLDAHDDVSASTIRRLGGRAARHTGDGYLAVFECPSSGVAAALAIGEALRHLRLEVRAGVHRGSVVLRGCDLAGLNVHIATRVAALARPSEVLVTDEVRQVLPPSEQRALRSRGFHRLKGVPSLIALAALADSLLEEGDRHPGFEVVGGVH